MICTSWSSTHWPHKHRTNLRPHISKVCSRSHTRLERPTSGLWRGQKSDIISNVRTMKCSHQPPQRRQMDHACHHLETTWQEKMTRNTSQEVERRPGQILERHDLIEDSTRQANLEEACWGIRPTTGHYGCPMMMMMISSCSIVWSVTLPLLSISDRLKSEVALCGALLELSMIHDIWEPAHVIPARGACL